MRQVDYRKEIAMKNYKVTYTIKANRQEIEKTKTIQANTAKEACAECKRIVRELTGRNAFRPTAKVAE